MNSISISLNKSTDDIVKTKSDIVKELIKFSVSSPGFTSTFFDNRSIAARPIIAKHGADLTALAIDYGNTLSVAIASYFPDDNIRVRVSPEQIEGSSYKLVVKITYGDGGAPVLERQQILVSSDSILLNPENKL